MVDIDEENCGRWSFIKLNVFDIDLIEIALLVDRTDLPVYVHMLVIADLLVLDLAVYNLLQTLCFDSTSILELIID